MNSDPPVSSDRQGYAHTDVVSRLEGPIAEEASNAAFCAFEKVRHAAVEDSPSLAGVEIYRSRQSRR